MYWIKRIPEIREVISEWTKDGATIGLVPTMGYFHEGHLALMEKARQENDYVVVSLFVNPIQFGPNEDFQRYPRDEERDRELAEKAGVDLVFNPTAEEMYGQGFQSYVEVTEISQGLCGASRPGHFRGVTTVITKLFNIVQPDRAYFGEKDAQQLRVIQRMVRDLNFPVEIKPVPTVREADGLAKSSRNTYLSPEERKAALVLSKSLFYAKEQVAAGEDSVQRLSASMKRMITGEPLVSLEYLEFRESATLRPVSTITGEVLIALAARVGKTRLIDNITVRPGRR
ncbi:MAG TPA: pantoate--beta-alanine ligase [Firmicutes bacterium]|nr:pantoate--beta-alanine ligase [Bacillota bacterium]